MRVRNGVTCSLRSWQSTLHSRKGRSSCRTARSFSSRSPRGGCTRAWGNDRKEVIAVPGGGPNGAALGPDGAIYVCNSGAIDREHGCHQEEGPDAVGRIERIDLATGKVDRLYERCGEIALGAPNDLVLDEAGGIWFTDFGKIRPRYWGKSALYYCQPDGSSINVAFSAAVNGRGFGAISYNGVGLVPGWKYRLCSGYEIHASDRVRSCGVRQIGAWDGSARRPR